VNCTSARDLLSAYFDQELEPDAASAVHAHLATCEDCARRLAEFNELSELSLDIRDPEVPRGAWSAIESSLSKMHEQRPRSTRGWWQMNPSRQMLAATALIGVGLVLLGYWSWRSLDQHVQMAVVFERYLGEFQEHPQAAQDILLSRYGGQRMDLQAVAAGQFTPNAPQNLPNGFERVETYLLDMPCCTCTQTIYKNPTGDILALLEHREEERSWFGNRAVIEAQCHGQMTCLVQLKNQLAASWKCGPRYLTVIGARDVEQVSELISFLDAHRPQPRS